MYFHFLSAVKSRRTSLNESEIAWVFRVVKMNLFFNVLAVTLVLLCHGEISRYILFSVDSVAIQKSTLRCSD